MITLESNDQDDYAFQQMMLKVKNGNFIWHKEWKLGTQEPSFDSVIKAFCKEGYSIECAMKKERGFEFIVTSHDATARFWVRPKSIDVSAYTQTMEKPVKLFEYATQCFSSYIAESDDENIVPIDIWSWNGDRSNCHTRLIECPSWSEIEDNYPAKTRKDVLEILSMKEPDKIGRIMLWHGTQGTGKSYGVRALVQAWQRKYRPTIIMDPSVFFTNASYLSKVVMSGAEPFDGEGEEKAETLVGQLIIVEDMPDLLLSESRAQHSDNMARLLNLSDGILGQGFRSIYLFTTNETLGEIDPAFTRPGRCLGVVEFPELNPSEAECWVKRKTDGRMTVEKKTYTLAELYQMTHSQERERREVTKKVGF